jgi:hypothetical protein
MPLQHELLAVLNRICTGGAIAHRRLKLRRSVNGEVPCPQSFNRVEQRASIPGSSIPHLNITSGLKPARVLALLSFYGEATRCFMNTGDVVGCLTRPPSPMAT